MENLDKGAIKKVEHHITDQLLSNILLVKKKDGENCPCINLKALNKFIPYKHFKMEGLHYLKYLLEENDFLCKIDLKDAKDAKGNFEMSGSPFSPSNHCFRINKIDRFDVLNCPSSSASLSPAKVFTKTTNTITKQGLLIPGRDSIKQSINTGTSLVSGKFKIKQWEITKAKGTKLVIQTDASKSGWRAFCNGVSTGGK